MSSSYTISSSLKTGQELIPYSTDSESGHNNDKKMSSSLPKLINLEQRPDSQCSSSQSLGTEMVQIKIPFHLCLRTAGQEEGQILH